MRSLGEARGLGHLRRAPAQRLSLRSAGEPAEPRASSDWRRKVRWKGGWPTLRGPLPVPLLRARAPVAPAAQLRAAAARSCCPLAACAVQSACLARRRRRPSLPLLPLLAMR